MTVTHTSSFIASWTTEPKMIFASSWASSRTSDMASLTSCRPRSGPPVTLINTAPSGEPLSLVVRIYQLRSDRAFGDMAYSAASADDGGKALLKDDLIAVRDVVLIPGKSYDMPQTLPEGGTVIGIVGLFHSPAAGRWKLAFDAAASGEIGITVGAHACALTAGRGALTDASPIETARTLSGVQCHT